MKGCFHASALRQGQHNQKEGGKEAGSDAELFVPGQCRVCVCARMRAQCDEGSTKGEGYEEAGLDAESLTPARCVCSTTRAAPREKARRRRAWMQGVLGPRAPKKALSGPEGKRKRRRTMTQVSVRARKECTCAHGARARVCAAGAPSVVPASVPSDGPLCICVDPSASPASVLTTPTHMARVCACSGGREHAPCACLCAVKRNTATERFVCLACPHACI